MRLFLTIGGPWLTDGPHPPTNDKPQVQGVRRPDGTVVVTHYEDGTERAAHYDGEGNLLSTEERRATES